MTLNERPVPALDPWPGIDRFGSGKKIVQLVLDSVAVRSVAAGMFPLRRQFKPDPRTICASPASMLKPCRSVCPHHGVIVGYGEAVETPLSRAQPIAAIVAVTLNRIENYPDI